MAIYDYSGNEISVNVNSIYVNVTSFGAKGNGITDDATSIQNALDSIKTTGGTIYFPPGTYIVKTSIRFYSNQHLIFDEKAILQSGASSVTGLLLGYVDDDVTGYNGLENVIIEGGTFNCGLSNQITLIGFSHAKNVVVKNAVINSTVTWHNLEFNAVKNGIIENCKFSGASKNGESSCLLQLDCMSGNNYPWEHVGTLDGTACNGIIIKDCFFENCAVSPFIGGHSTSGENVRIHNCTFENNTSGRGAVNFSTLSKLDVYECTFTNCTNGVSVSSGASSCSVHDNRFTGATTPISDAITVKYNNWINGAFAS